MVELVLHPAIPSEATARATTVIRTVR